MKACHQAKDSVKVTKKYLRYINFERNNLSLNLHVDYNYVLLKDRITMFLSLESS